MELLFVEKKIWYTIPKDKPEESEDRKCSNHSTYVI